MAVDVQRREFITLLGGGAATWPFAAHAQSELLRIGVLLPATSDDAQFQAYLGAFLQALTQSGWTIGRNVQDDTHEAISALLEAAEVRRLPCYLGDML
jgi:putative ABC transport system substrate-binding protein